MKRNISCALSAVLYAAFLASAVSCGPSAYTLSVETSQPSVSGVNLAGKTVAVSSGTSLRTRPLR